MWFKPGKNGCDDLLNTGSKMDMQEVDHQQRHSAHSERTQIPFFARGGGVGMVHLGYQVGMQ